MDTVNLTAEPLRGHRPAVPGGRQAQVLRLQVALQQLGDALRDTERGERHELRQLQGAKILTDERVVTCEM